METATSGAANGEPPIPSPVPTAVDANAIVEHLSDLLEITLGASSEDLEGHGSLLSKDKRPETVQRCQRFASEAQTVLYVQKELIAADKANGVNGHAGKLLQLCLHGLG